MLKSAVSLLVKPPALSPGLRVSSVMYMYVVFRIRYMIAGRKMLTVMCSVIWFCRFLWGGGGVLWHHTSSPPC